MIRPNSFTASTDAQAFTLGVVLFIIIAVSATTIYLAINAPIETKKCEFQHSNEVTEDFIMLNSIITSLLHAEPPASTSVPIKTTPTKESIIALPLAPGIISFSPYEGNIIVRLSESGDGSSGTWTLDNFTGNYSTVSGSVNDSTGNLNLSGPPYTSACIVSNMTNIYGYIGNDTTGSNSTVYGNISWYAITSPPATEITMKVRTSIFPNMTNATDWIEVENGENLSSRLPTLNGHRYVQFRAELVTGPDTSKTPTLINVSIDYSSPYEGVTLADTSGAITFKSGYHYLPNMNLTYENGAVIKSQTEGGFVQCPFNFSFQNVSGTRTRINISLVNLTGANVSGRAGEATLVRLLLIDRKLVSPSFFYSNLTINVTSYNYRIIKNWFNKTLEEANMIYLQDYNVSYNETAKTVSVEFYAKEHGIELYLEKATVGVTL